MKWVEQLGLALQALERAKFPKNSICHHHGVCVLLECPAKAAGLVPSLCGRGMLIMLYQVNYDEERGLIDWPKELFDEYRKGCAVYGKIIKTWNGEPGHPGISIVIDFEPPAGFVRALDNYRQMGNVFEPTPKEKRGFAAFDRAWSGALAKVGLK